MSAPTIPEIPGQTVGVDFGQSQVNPVWYGFIRSLLVAVKYAVDFAKDYVPPGPDASKSNVTRTVNPQTGTSYTFALTDAGNVVTFSNSSAVTVTIPTNASVAFPNGAQIDFIQRGTGKVTIGGSGVTINSIGGYKSLAAQHAWGSLLKVDTNTWQLGGTLAA